MPSLHDIPIIYLTVLQTFLDRRMLTESGQLNFMMKKKIILLVVEQNVTYTRQILPFRNYVVTTTLKISDDDKWMHYRHSFDAPADPKSDTKPTHYALIDVKAVMKEFAGKTVKPSEVFATSSYFANVITK
jgi:acyl-CoA thioesterase FadM